jgi:hypothetical protein
LEASKALEAANASGDAQKIKAAMAALEAALKGQAQARADVAAANAAANTEAAAPAAEGANADQAPSEAAAPPKPTAKPLVAMRGDDRPGMKKAEPAPAGRGGKFGDRKGAPGGRFGDRRDDRGPRDARRGEREDRGPRLGDVAFRAQREALEHAQSALRKLAAQAHGEALTQLMAAWESRSADQLPSQQELGRSAPAGVRSAWAKALGNAPAGDAGEALLRLEIAAEAPTPAEHLSARRAMQLQLLTRRNDPSPAQTWAEDTARVLATAYDAANARRLQNALKVLMR